MTNSHRVSALALALAFTACSSGRPQPPGELVKSNKQRITTTAPQADIDATVAGTTSFAIDVYKRLIVSTNNVVFSPYSVTIALAMTYAGARTTTASAFESTMHIGLPADRYHAAMNTLDSAMRSRGQGAHGQDGRPFRLTLDNQIFAQKGYGFVPDFLDVLATDYGAGVRLLDFIAAAEPARQAINAWIRDDTAGLIPELLDKDKLDSSTRFLLVNALYFDAAWMTKFDHSATQLADFHLLDGTVRQVPTMSQQHLGGRGALVGGTQVIEVFYDGMQVSMVLLVPASGQFGAFEKNLSAAELQRHQDALDVGGIGLAMPKFSFASTTEMSRTLTELGLGLAFTDAADFSGLAATGPMSMSHLTHQAIIKTDEDGTKAAAATAVGITQTGGPPPVYTVDSPFIFLIRDVATGVVIFMGRVVDPS
jgi:serpin B